MTAWWSTTFLRVAEVWEWCFSRMPFTPHERSRQHDVRAAHGQGDERLPDGKLPLGSSVHVGLSDHLNKKPRLSGGQRQRALGRALIRRPKVLLMDEPLSNLDAELRHQMRHEIRRLHDELGTTTIYVTHDQIEAMTLADRVAILDKGVLQQHAPPLVAYREPANEFVQSFLCRHLDDLVETANTLLRPSEEGLMFTRTPTVVMTALLLIVLASPLVANDAEATNGRTGEFITLTYNGNASSVELAGEWNWSETLQMNGNGDVWTADIELQEGLYCYKFIVDGAYMFDPSNPERVYCDGIENSLLRVDDHLRPHYTASLTEVALEVTIRLNRGASRRRLSTTRATWTDTATWTLPLADFEDGSTHQSGRF